MANDIPGIDDFIAQEALAGRALLRQLVGEPLPACGRRFMHPRRPAEVDTFGAMVDTCACVRASGHDFGCWCAHGIQRVVYRVDDDGREHYATVPLRPR
jgi:hypothetical protein